MIRELRRAHARLAVGLAVVPPLLLAAAVLTRAPEPRVADLPAAAPGAGVPLVLAPEFPLQVGASPDSLAGGLRIVARATAPLRAPDALLYWTPAEPAAGGGLPAGARFVAAVGAGRAIQALVPAARLDPGGRLVLVTHPDRRIAATTPARLPPPGER